ncbi:MAG: hypothetical protein ACOX83_10345 [Candidatus Spyradocola sp.]|jgi:hypothetical protein
MRILDGIPGALALSPWADLPAWRAYAAALSPALPSLCEADAAQYDWAREVLPVVRAALAQPERLRALEAAFLRAADRLRERAPLLFGGEPDLLVLLYVGLCSGAGWATRLAETDAVLLGAEKILELGWEGDRDLQGLLFHEIGHIWHARRTPPVSAPSGPRQRAVLQLFREGVAMACEQFLCKDPAFFNQDKDGWLDRCRARDAELRQEFLRRLTEGRDVQPFFGDWTSLDGLSDAGYYLGARFLQSLQADLPLAEAAILPYPEVEHALLRFLRA